MDSEPLAQDTCKPSKGIGQNGSFYQNSPLNHLKKMPPLYRAKDPDVEIRVHNFGTRCNKNDINLQTLL